MNGPNGAGETTLINLLSGVTEPTDARILLDGQDISSLPTHQRVRLGIARTFQIDQRFKDLTPLETIGLAVSQGTRPRLVANRWQPVGPF